MSMTTTSSVTTNTNDYAPGSYAIITATGFSAGSSVTFDVEHVSDPGADGIFGTADDVIIDMGGAGHEAWTITDGGLGDLDGLINGSIVTTWYVDPDDSAGERFLLTASTLSGWFASNTFTDAKPVTGQGEPANPNNPGGSLIETFLVSSTAGTGIIHSIVKIASNTTFEQGYNSDFRDVQFDETNAANFNRAITLAEIPVVDINGVSYREFDLDLNEDNGSTNPLITLQTLMIFASDTNSLTGFDPVTHTFPAGTATLIYNMDQAGNVSTLLTDWNSGSGTGDYAFFIPELGVNGLTGFAGLPQEKYIYIYSEFGTLNGQGSGVSGGFEEWFVVTAPNPSMTIDKTASITGNVVDQAGDVINYTLLVSNSGNVDLTGVTVTDPYADAGSIARGTDLFGDNDNILELAEVWSYTATHTVTQAEIDSNGGGDGFLENTATADSTQTDPVSDAANVPVLQLPSLNITKDATVSGGTANAAGELISYTITVANTGNTTLTDVTVTDPYADAGSIIRVTDVAGDNDALLEVGETWGYTATHMVTQAEIDSNGGSDGLLENAATADSAETGEDTDDASVPVDRLPSLNITKDATVPGGAANAAGELISYTITVANTGNTTLTDVTVTDPYADADPTYFSGDVNTDGELDVGETWSYAATHTVTQAEIDSNGGGNGLLENAATADSAETGEDTDDASVPVDRNPVLNITKDAAMADSGPAADAAGDVINYTITVANTGNTTLTDVTVTDPYADAGSIIRVADVAGDNDALLEVGETWGYTATHTVTQAEIDSNGGSDGLLENTATADSTETGEDTDDASVPVDRLPSLNITKDAAMADGGPAADAAGDVINYTITVANTGNTTLTDVTVTDPYADADPTYVSGDVNTDGELDVGEAWSYTATHTVTQAEIDSNGGGNGLLENTATADSAETGEDTDDATVPVDQNKALHIEKDADLTVVDTVGQTITYAYLVTNTGNAVISNVVVADDNANSDPTDDFNPSYVDGDTDSDGKLDVDETWTYSATRGVTQAMLDAGTAITNVATVTGDDATPDDDDATVPVDQNKALHIEKDADLTVVDTVAQTITYTYLVTNIGNAVISNVVVVDDNANSDPADDFNPSYVDGDTDSDGKLDVDETWTYAATRGVTQAMLDAGTAITNVVTVTGDDATPDDDDATVPVDQNPAIDINKVTVCGALSGDGLTGIHTGDAIGWRYTVTNTGNTALSNVMVTDNNGTSANTDDDFSAAYFSGDSNSNNKLDVGETWTFTASGTAVSGTYANTGYVSGTSSDGQEVTDSDLSGYTAVPREALIAPTNTTPYQYISGTAMSFQDYYASQGGDIQYGVKSGKISQTNPGVFFYFTGASGDIAGVDGPDADTKADTMTVTIDQTLAPSGTTSAFNPLNYSNIQLYKVIDDGDGVVDAGDTLATVSSKSYSVSIVNGDVSITFAPDAVDSMYVIGVKYQTSSVVGNTVTKTGGVYPTVNYQFDTVLNGSIIETYDGGVDLVPKPATGSKMLLAGEGGDGARSANDNQVKVLVDAAKTWWAAHGGDMTALQDVSVDLSDLGQDGDGKWILGVTDGSNITLDDDGAGLGWSTGVGGVARHKVDMLSVLVHEMGHVLGMSDEQLGDMLVVGDRMMPANEAGEDHGNDHSDDHGDDDGGMHVAMADLPEPAETLGAIGLQQAEHHVSFS
jgi:uncharacterized repeat protein (TIGR01451 family)